MGYIVVGILAGIILPIVAANTTLPVFLYVIMSLLGIALCIFSLFMFFNMILCIKEYKQLKHEEYLEMLRLEKLRRQWEAVAPILPRVVYDLILRNGSIDCQDAVDMCQRDERIKRNDEYIRCQLSSDVKQVLNELSDCGKIGKVYIGNMYIYKNISDEGTHMSSVNIELSVE